MPENQSWMECAGFLCGTETGEISLFFQLKLRENLLQRVSTANGIKNHVQHVCPSRLSQRTNADAHRSCQSSGEFTSYHRDSSYCTCCTFKVGLMVLRCRGKMPEHETRNLGSNPPRADHVVRALNCQETGTPLLYPPLLYSARGFFSGIDPPALHRSPVGTAIHPASILCFRLLAVLWHMSPNSVEPN